MAATDPQWSLLCRTRGSRHEAVPVPILARGMCSLVLTPTRGTRDRQDSLFSPGWQNAAVAAVTCELLQAQGAAPVQDP